MDISSLNVLLTRSFLLPASLLLLVGTGIIGMFSNQGSFFPIKKTLAAMCKNLAIFLCLFGFMLLGCALMTEIFLSPTELNIELSESIRSGFRTFADRSYWEVLFLGCTALVLATAATVINYFARIKEAIYQEHIVVKISMGSVNGNENNESPGT